MQRVNGLENRRAGSALRHNNRILNSTSMALDNRLRYGTPPSHYRFVMAAAAIVDTKNDLDFCAFFEDYKQ